jgi:hypothetical protein
MTALWLIAPYSLVKSYVSEVSTASVIRGTMVTLRMSETSVYLDMSRRRLSSSCLIIYSSILDLWEPG